MPVTILRVPERGGALGNGPGDALRQSLGREACCVLRVLRPPAAPCQRPAQLPALCAAQGESWCAAYTSLGTHHLLPHGQAGGLAARTVLIERARSWEPG